MDSGSNDVVVKTDEIQSSCNAIPTNARREQESFQECGYQHLSNSSGLEYGANSEAKLHRNCDNNEDRVKSTAMERSFMIIDKNSGTFVTELNNDSELASSLVSKSDMKEFEQNSSDCNGNYDKYKTLNDQRGSIHGFDAKISSSLSAFEDDDDSPFDGHPVVSFGSQHEIVALYQGTSSKTSNFKKRSGSFASQINSSTQGQIPDHSSTSSNPFDLEAEELFPFFDDDDTPSSNSDGGLEFDVFDSQIQGNSQKSRTSSWSNTPFFDRPLLTDDDFHQDFHRSIKVTDIDSLFTQQNVSLDENEEEMEVFRSEVNEREKQDDKTIEEGTTEDKLFNLFATEMTRNDKRTRNFERLTFNSNDSILDVVEVITPEESPRENVNLNNLFLEDCANEDKIIPIVLNKKHKLFEDFLFQESVSTTERKDAESTHGSNFLDMRNGQTACVSQDSNERSELLDDTTTEGDTDISVNDLKMNGVDIITACHNDDDDKLCKTVDKDDEMIISNSDREEIEVVCVLQEDSSEMNAGGVAGRVNNDGGDIVGLEEIEVSCVVQVASSFNDSGDNDAVVCGETGSCVVQVDGKELHASSVASSFNGGGGVSSSDVVSAYNSVGSCYGNNDDTAGHEEAEVESVVIQVDDREVTLCNGDGTSSGDSVGVECSGNTSGDVHEISNSVSNGNGVGSLIEDVGSGDGPSSCNDDFSRNNHVSDQIYGGKDFKDDDYGLSEEDDSGSASFVVYPEIIVKALQSTDSAGAGDICQDIDTNNDASDCQVGHHVEIPNESCGKSSFVDSVSGNGQCSEDRQICVNDGGYDNLSDDDKINVIKYIDDVTRNKDDVITSEDDVTVVLDVNSIDEDQREEHVSDLDQAKCDKANDKNNDSCQDEFFERDHNQDNKKSDVTEKLNDAVANCDVIIIIDSADQNDDTIICTDDDDKTILIENDVRENVNEQNTIKSKSVFDLKSSEESTNSRRKSSESDSDHLRMLKNMTVTDQLLKAHSHNPRTSEDPKAAQNTLGYLSDKNRTELSLDERILNVNRSIDWVRSVIMEMRTQDLTLKIQFDGLRQEIRNLQHEFEHYGVDCDYYKDDELLNLEYLDYKSDEQKNHINTNTALREDSGYHSDTSSVSDSKDYGKGKVANVTKAKYLYEPIPSFPKVKTLTSSKCVFEIVL